MRIRAASDARLIDTIDPAAVERFRADWIAIADAPGADRPAGLAVSGGADSLALLLLARAAFPGAVAAATVDHGLRAESAAEARFVADLCARLGVGHHLLAADPAAFATGNLQDRARAARYRLLGEWANTIGAPWLATAHQQDDIAESFLLRARRGAGVGGLAAMARVRPLAEGVAGPALVRPLLGWSRKALAAIVDLAGIDPVDDPSNANPLFDRSRMRALIAASPDLPAARLARAAINLRDVDQALAWTAGREWDARATRPGLDRIALDLSGLPHELRRRLVARAIAEVRSGDTLSSHWHGTGLDRLVAAVDAGEVATLAGVVVRPGSRWGFAPAPPRRSR
ncbi:tRNA lysidine(34) synthetase TilS [Sphingomonas sp. RS6]